MKEEWRPVTGYSGYEVSNFGQIRSYWKKQKKSGCWGGVERVFTDEPYIVPQSDDGNGYLKVFMVNDDGSRHCRKVHRIVAEEFLKHDASDDTVDHVKSGPDGKLDNSVTNLRWISRRANIQKAYKDGVCDSRILKQRKPVVLTDIWTGEEKYYFSIAETAAEIGVDYTTISHALRSDGQKVRHYIVEYANEEDRLLHGRTEEDY